MKHMNRRTAIQAALGTIMNATMTQAAGTVNWSYDGKEGPEFWGGLSEDFATCSFGKQQSPIDLTDTIAGDVDDMDLSWNPSADWEAVNNGHTIQANTANGGFATIHGKVFNLVQFHFHAPSEHAIDGKRFAMEAHFVHAAKDGTLAVVGVMMEGGGSNALFDRVMANASKGKGDTAIGTGNAEGLLPNDRKFFRYAGSLTTPPCSETVMWTVLQVPIQVSDAAIAAFTGIYDHDARPLQARNRRFIVRE